MSTRVVVVSDLLSGNPDMGERVYTRGISQALEARGATVVSVAGPSEVAHEFTDAGRLLAHGELGTILQRLRPDVVLYPQRSSLTFGGVIRSWRLRSLAGCPVVPVIFMPQRLHGLSRVLAKRLRPAAVASLSQEALEGARVLWPGIRADVVPAAIDDRFIPASTEVRTELRDRLGLSPDLTVVLHAGHLSHSRNLEALRVLTTLPAVRVVVLVSSATSADVAVRTSLVESGISLIEGFVPDVQDVFRAADAYVFPTVDSGGCIGVPLSVLEALACGVPVATTTFGTLPSLLRSNPGVAWIDDNEGIVDAVRAAIALGPSRQPYFSAGWDQAAEALLGLAEEVL